MSDNAEERVAKAGMFDAGSAMKRPARGGLGSIRAPASDVPVFASTVNTTSTTVPAATMGSGQTPGLEAACRVALTTSASRCRKSTLLPS